MIPFKALANMLGHTGAHEFVDLTALEFFAQGIDRADLKSLVDLEDPSRVKAWIPTDVDQFRFACERRCSSCSSLPVSAISRIAFAMAGPIPAYCVRSLSERTSSSRLSDMSLMRAAAL